MFSVKKIGAASLALATVFALSACSGDNTEKPSGSASPSSSSSDAAADLKLVSAGTLTVCSNAPFAPFEYEGPDGSLTGIDIDLTKLAAQDLGLEYKAVQYDFDAMSSGAAFAANACDVLATGMTITEERLAKFSFSEPYYDANQGVMVSAGSTIAGLADLKGKKVGAQVDTTGKTESENAGLSVVEFPEVGSLIQAVATGQIDAAVADLGVLQSYVSEELTIAYTLATNEQYGFGVAKENTALAEALSKAVSEAKASGEYDKIITTHVGAAGN